MWYLARNEVMASFILLLMIVFLILKIKTMDENIEILENRLEILENESINNMRINYEKQNDKYNI